MRGPEVSAVCGSARLRRSSIFPLETSGTWQALKVPRAAFCVARGDAAGVSAAEQDVRKVWIWA